MSKIEVDKYKVRIGDYPWAVARQSLEQQGKKASNEEIIKELNRLSLLNGCNSVEDFGKKYFTKIGQEIVVKEKVLNIDEINKNNYKNKPDSVKSVPEKEQDSIFTIGGYSLQPLKSSDPIEKYFTNRAKLAKKEIELDKDIDEINRLENDAEKIIQYNKKHGNSNYVIVDKKTCTATIYNKDGQELKSYEILLGQDKGDNLSKAFAKEYSERTYTTVPGEFKLSGKRNTFGGMYFLGNANETFDPDIELRPDVPGSNGKKKLGYVFQALHATANTNVRDIYYDNDNLEDNRQSMGCVNISIDNFKEMETQYGIKVGSTLYILPEDEGNKLVLKRLNNGTVKFGTDYADEEQNQKLEKIQNKKVSK